MNKIEGNNMWRLGWLALLTCVSSFHVAAQEDAQLDIEYAESGVSVSSRGASLSYVLHELARKGGFDIATHSGGLDQAVNLERQGTLNDVLARLLRNHPHTIEFTRTGRTRVVARLIVLSGEGSQGPLARPAVASEEAPIEVADEDAQLVLIEPMHTTDLLNGHATPGRPARGGDGVTTAEVIEDAYITAMKPWEQVARETRREQELQAFIDAQDQRQEPAAAAPAPATDVVDIEDHPEFEALQAKLAPVAQSASRNVKALVTSLREAQAARWE